MMKTVCKMLMIVIAAYACIVATLSILYLAVPPVSTLMLARWATLQRVHYTPVAIDAVSPHLLRMIIRAEDSRFCSHQGVDWQSLGDTIEDAAEDGPTRGASTIPMQVTKNLFLWPQQSYLRKAIEIPLAMALSVVWPKSRMLEIYVSVAEWGDGIFGIEAAARTYFGKSAGALTPREAALLAAALPNPKQRNPARPSAYHARYADSLMKWATADVDISCVR